MSIRKDNYNYLYLYNHTLLFVLNQPLLLVNFLINNNVCSNRIYNKCNAPWTNANNFIEIKLFAFVHGEVHLMFGEKRQVCT